MSEESSKSEKGKQIVVRAGEAFTRTVSTISGKNVEQQVSEYSDRYTQLLLGMQQDLEAQGRKITGHASDATNV